jgi:hypothetical protein
MGDPIVPPVARSSVILPLWLSAFVFGHVFALFWFIRAALLKNPQLSLAGLLRRSRRKGGLPQSSEDANRTGSLEAGVLAEATDAAAATTLARRPGGGAGR